MNQPKAERHHPAFVTEHRAQIVQRHQQDGRGDDRLHEARGEPHHVQRGETQRDRMRHRERGHDLQHVEEGGAKPFHAAPLPAVATQHGGQQQREQEQDVIEPNPDVPDALADERPPLRPAVRGHAQREGVLHMRVVEGHRLRARVVFQAQQPVHVRVDVEEHAGVDLNHRGRRGQRLGGEEQPRVFAIVQRQRGEVRHLKHQRVAVRLDREPCHHIEREGFLTARQFIGAQQLRRLRREAEAVLKIEQGDVPAGREVRAGEGKAQVSLARRVPPRAQRQEPAQEPENSAACESRWHGGRVH